MQQIAAAVEGGVRSSEMKQFAVIAQKSRRFGDDIRGPLLLVAPARHPLPDSVYYPQIPDDLETLHIVSDVAISECIAS